MTDEQIRQSKRDHAFLRMCLRLQVAAGTPSRHSWGWLRGDRFVTMDLGTGYFAYHKPLRA